MTLSIVVILSNVTFAVETGEGMDDAFMVKSDGAELFLRVRGRDITNPVILYLHGGPGEANGPLLFQAYAGPELEKHFVVGYLHQRCTCMSPEAPVNTLKIKQFVEDVDHVVTFLKEKFQKDSIFLLGHSFGGGLGYLYLLEHEGTIEKFVSAGGVFSCVSMEENGYRTVMDLAKKADNQEAVERLKALGPPPYETLQQGMVWRMMGMNLLTEMNESMTENLDMSQVISITGIEKIDPYWMNKSMIIASTMWKELANINLEDEVKNIDTPLLLIAGAKDIMVPFRILEKGFNNYGGQKEYFILEKSNHMMFVDEPELFVTKVIEFLKK